LTHLGTAARERNSGLIVEGDAPLRIGQVDGGGQSLQQIA